VIATSAKAAGSRPESQSSTEHRQDKTKAKSRSYPRLKVDRSLPGRGEAMTDLSKIKIVGVSLQAAYLFSWLSDYAGGHPKLDAAGRWVIEVKPQHAPTLAEFATLRPGRNGTTSDRSARRWLAELVGAGMVETIRTRTGNGYLLVIPEAAVDRRLTRQAAKAHEASVAEADRTEASARQDRGVRQIGHGCPPDRTRVSSRCHDRLDRQDTPSNTTPIPSGHSIQEPCVPPDVQGDGDGDGDGVGDPGKAVPQAMIDLHNAETRTEAKAALGRLAGQARLTEAEFTDLRFATITAIDRVWFIETRHKADRDKAEALADRWLAEFGIAVNDPNAALDALRRVGVSERMIDNLIRSKPPQVIVEAVRNVEHKANVRSKAGAVVAILTGKRRETMTEASAA
jgi:hypothetical protein